MDVEAASVVRSLRSAIVERERTILDLRAQLEAALETAHAAKIAARSTGGAQLWMDTACVVMRAHEYALANMMDEGEAWTALMQAEGTARRMGGSHAVAEMESLRQQLDDARQQCGAAEMKSQQLTRALGDLRVKSEAAIANDAQLRQQLSAEMARNAELSARMADRCTSPGGSQGPDRSEDYRARIAALEAALDEAMRRRAVAEQRLTSQEVAHQQKVRRLEEAFDETVALAQHAISQGSRGGASASGRQAGPRGGLPRQLFVDASHSL